VDAANIAQEDDLVLLIAKDYKRFLVRLRAGGELQTHRGVLRHWYWSPLSAI